MEDKDGRCPICREYRADLHHNNTVHHRFSFMKWAYHEYRKALLKDRHGVVLEITAKKIDNFNFRFYEARGKYITKVSPEQLQRHGHTITYTCTIRNCRKDPIYTTNANLLHPYKYFDIKHFYDFNGEDSFLKLLPGAHYKFEVHFKTDIRTGASYKIPLSCDFQTVDDKYNFSIVRTFLTEVDENTDSQKIKQKSPFTSQPWVGVETTIPTTKDVAYVDKYPIPGKYGKLLFHGLERFNNMTLQDEQNLTELSRLVQKLTMENYNRFWHILLWLEEKAQSLMLMKYNMQGVTMKVNGDILELEVPGLAEKRPSVIVGDFIKIRAMADHTVYVGFICQVNETTVNISHVDEVLLEFLGLDPNLEMDVSFMLSRLAYERMHAAVDRLVETRMVTKLFPPAFFPVRTNKAVRLQDSQFFNKSVALNADQKNAVMKILNTTHDFPYIVFGPPGTGKTVTIVEAILQMKKRTKKRILVCAPANSACDLLATKLIPHCSKEELLRVHSSTRERTTIMEELKDYSNMEDEEFTKVTFDKLITYRIVVSTLTLIGRFAGRYEPDCVFVDEAAQASEPETDIAIALTGKQVILAGDPKQLGPMATARAGKLGLEISLLERLMTCSLYSLNEKTKTYDNNFITMLRLNFRSHPDILYISNELFYNNLLQPVCYSAQQDPIVELAIYPGLKKATKVKGCAVEFCSVSAKERKEGSSPSFFNLYESKLVVKYVQALVSLPLPEVYKVRADQIGVVTPYKRQVFKIKEGLKYHGFGEIEVGTTESFQGREKRIILISTVRAQHSLLLHDRKYNLGFVKHDQRFNVAVTRAISKLIVIGCPLILKTDSKWEKFINLCEQRGTSFGNLIANDDEEFKRDVLDRMERFQHKDGQFTIP